MSRHPRIVITLGDPCGIGPEILVRTLRAVNRWAEVVVVGARAGMDLLQQGGGPSGSVFWRFQQAPTNGPEVPGAQSFLFQTNSQPEWTHLEHALTGAARWLDPTPEIEARQLRLGQGSPESGRCAVEAVRVGAQLVMGGMADALVTLPLSKNAAHQAGYDIPGHTEFLQRLSGSPITRMAFVSPSLSVVLHTVHQSLRSVVEELNAEAVAETLSFAADRFIQLTGKLDLRVALCALNPHGGEGGAFGVDEILLGEALTMAEGSFLNFGGDTAVGPFADLPSPFIPGPVPQGWEVFPTKAQPKFSVLRGQGDLEVVSLGPGPEAQSPPGHPSPRFFGPLPADTLFQRAARKEFDLVVALYHDQGLIPLKVLEPTRAVNLTLGLPFIRTSPDHGTAFDKAGRWAADPTNFLEATALAVRLAGRARQEPWQAEVTDPGSSR
jgi:4-hydroxythreonine-4-phosphate dehydrogenase